ncbi:MAG: hypothetical protein ACQEXJ_01720 [Myxococcota bacterium]
MSRLLAFAAALGLTASAATAAAAPQYVRVSFGDPDTAHTAAVTWNTDTLDEPSLVEFGTTTSYAQSDDAAGGEEPDVGSEAGSEDGGGCAGGGGALPWWTALAIAAWLVSRRRGRTA